MRCGCIKQRCQEIGLCICWGGNIGCGRRGRYCPSKIVWLFISLLCVAVVESQWGAVAGKRIVRYGKFDDIPLGIHYITQTRAFDTAEWEFHSYSVSSGIHMLDLVNSGVLDFAATGSSPTALGVYREMPLVVFGVQFYVGDMEAMVYRSELGIKGPKDLKKNPKLRYAVPFGSTTHFHALLGLTLFGIQATDIELVFMKPSDMFEAWDKKAIDCTYIWYPMLGHALANGGKIMYSSLTLGQWGAKTSNFWITTEKFASENQDILKHVLQVMIAVDEDMRSEGSFALWRPGGSRFNSAVTSFNGPDFVGSAQYPGTYTSAFMGVLIQGSVVSKEQQQSAIETDIQTAIVDAGTFFVEQKLLSKANLQKDLTGVIHKTPMAEALANPITFASLPSSTYTQTFTTQEENCESATPIVLSSSAGSYSSQRDVSSNRVCIVSITSTSSVKIEFQYFWLEGNGIRVYHKEILDDNLIMQYTGKGVARPIAHQGPLIVEITLSSNGGFPTLNGFGPFGVAVEQGVEFTFVASVACTTNQDCGSTIGQGACDTSRGVCVCEPGFSGMDCSEKSCGGARSYSTEKGNFRVSPVGVKYLPNRYCWWIIAPTGASVDSTIKLTISAMDIEDGFDALTVYKGQGADKVLETVFKSSTENEAVLFIKGPAVSMSFESSFVANRNGFSVAYELIVTNTCSPLTCSSVGGSCSESGECACKSGYFGQGCWSASCLEDSGVITSLTGAIQSQAGKYYDTVSRTCKWTVSLPATVNGSARKGIKVSFDKFHLENLSEDKLTITGVSKDRANDVKLFTMSESTCALNVECNFGKCVENSSGTLSCVCPSGYFGGKCEYESEVSISAADNITVEFVQDINNKGSNVYEGFQLSYEAQYECPNNCTDELHGTCYLGQCQCINGYSGASCQSKDSEFPIIIVVCGTGGLIVIILLLVYLRFRQRKFVEKELRSMRWKIEYIDLHSRSEDSDSQFSLGRTSMSSVGTGYSPMHAIHGRPSIISQAKKIPNHTEGKQPAETSRSYRRNARFYKGKAVHVKSLGVENLRTGDFELIELQALFNLDHALVATFVGAVLDAPHASLVYAYYHHGTLLDFCNSDRARDVDIDMKYTFSHDIYGGLSFLHRSGFNYHGYLSSENCIIDKHWSIRLMGFGLEHVYWTNRQSVWGKSGMAADHNMRKLYWSAPELLNFHRVVFGMDETYYASDDRKKSQKSNSSKASLWSVPSKKKSSIKKVLLEKQTSITDSILTAVNRKVSNVIRSINFPPISVRQKGDIYAYGMIMYEVLYCQEPYSDMHLSVENTVKTVEVNTEFRPDLNKENCAKIDSRVKNLIAKMWDFVPENRPSLKEVRDVMRNVTQFFGTTSILQTMMQKLSTYSTQLEIMVEERTEELKEEKVKMTQLLGELLPSSVVERLVQGQSVEPESFDRVSIFFSDIVGFTNICAQMSPLQVVDLLNNVYIIFDDIISMYRVYKVETIGDAYMVASGVPIRDSLHYEHIAKVALHMISSRSRIKLPSCVGEGNEINFRLGLHSGPTVGGVVGSKMPRYCLFGDTINTASRMESTGVKGRIQVSETFKKCLDSDTVNEYDTEERGTMEVKGKGMMTTYFLNGFRQRLQMVSVSNENAESGSQKAEQMITTLFGKSKEHKSDMEDASASTANKQIDLLMAE
eukprot:Nk52_evm21s1916 gene=Nk52_evmTU21s1916